MPKSKKKKRADFQKVKLKVGKRLPKGDNVTNLSFKTRQIQLTQRIKDDDGQDLVTKKKLNVQDLLRQCDHHSSSSRVSAVMGLREVWLSNHPDMMTPTNVFGYTTILKKLSSLLIDSEATVRHAVVNLLKTILHKITKDATTASGHSERLLGGNLFAHIHAFLSCAMNHVHEDVRLDALILYDTLLETCPGLVVQQTGGLLHSLVGLLASPTQGPVGSRGDKTTQKLSLNPESRLPVMVFRVKVLARIKRTLLAALSDKMLSSKSCPTVPVQHKRVWSLHNDHGEGKGRQSTMIVPSQMSNRFQVIANGGSHDLDDYITNSSSLESFTQQCVPVMLQCWTEARADRDSIHESVSALSPETIELKSLVVAIIQLLLVLAAHVTGRGQQSGPVVPLGAITSSCLESLQQLIMAGFPYSAQHQGQSDINLKRKKKKKGKEATVQSEASILANLDALNLGICDIMASFCTDRNTQLREKLLKKIGRFLVWLLSQAPNTEQGKVLVRIIKQVFSNPHTADHMTKVYDAALKWFLAVPLKSQQKRLLFDLFAGMGRVWDGWFTDRNDTSIPEASYLYKENKDIERVLVEFFLHLPHLALAVHAVGDESWTVAVLELMCHGRVGSHSEAFGNHLSQVLDPAKGLFTSANELIQQRVCAVIATGTFFCKDDLKQLLQLLRSPPDKPSICGRKSWSCASHLLFAMFDNIRICVPLKSQKKFNLMGSEQRQHLSDYLRFLFSLQLGYTGEELEQICPVARDSRVCVSWFNIDFSTQETQWDRHLDISKVVARQVASLCLPPEPEHGYKLSFTLVSNFEHFWTQTFAQRERMPVLSVIGLGHLVLQCSQACSAEMPGPALYSLLALSVASVLAALYEADTVSALATSLTWQVKAEMTSILASLSTTSAASSVLRQVVEFLQKRSQGDFGGSDSQRQAAKSAQDFLYTDEILKHKLPT